MDRNVLNERPKSGRHDTTFVFLLGDVHFDENPSRTFRATSDLGGEVLRVERVEQAHGGHHVLHLASLELADEVERQPAPRQGAPGLEVLEGVLAHHLHPGLDERGGLVRGNVLAREHQLNRARGAARHAGGGVQLLAHLREHRAQALVADHQAVAHASPPGGRRRSRRAGTSRSAPARSWCRPPPPGRPTVRGPPPPARRVRPRPGRRRAAAPPPRRTSSRRSRAPPPTPGSSTGPPRGPRRRPSAPAARARARPHRARPPPGRASRRVRRPRPARRGARAARGGSPRPARPGRGRGGGSPGRRPPATRAGRR